MSRLNSQIERLKDCIRNLLREKTEISEAYGAKQMEQRRRMKSKGVNTDVTSLCVKTTIDGFSAPSSDKTEDLNNEGFPLVKMRA